MRLKLFFLHTFLLLSVTLLAFDRAEYYAAANNKSGAALKTALCGVIGKPQVKSYNELWTYYYQTDRASDNSVIDRYCNTKRYFGNSASSTAVSGMNKEHGVAQSWWGGGTSTTEMIGCDIMHVMPSDTEANSRKSNYGMGLVTQPMPKKSEIWTNGSIKVGQGKAGSNGTISLWEPSDEWKGDFARIYFYIVTCYENKDLTQAEGSKTMLSGTYPKLQDWAVELYMKWSREDPISAIERQRNDSVQKVQSNRNPYVDFPGLEQYVWGTLKNTGVSVSNYVNPYEDDVPILENPEISFATTSVTLAADDYFEQTVTTNSDGEVSYSSSDEQVATVDGEGQVHALSTGKTIITASVSETSKYAAASASYTVYVTIDGDDPPMPTGNTYVKVTTEPRDWTGTYLVVYENGNQAYVLDASRSTIDASGNYVVADIEQSEIAASAEVNDASLVVTGVVEGYTLRTSSGLYLTTEDGKKISATQDPYSFLLSLDSDGAVIRPVKRSSVNLMYNSSWKGFRFYSSGQQPIQLYRRTEADHIDVIQNSKFKIANDNVYDLAGRRVTNPQKGQMYIVDGKVIVK